MNYKLFLDESGDHGLLSINKDFPVFLLCGVLFTEEDYETTRQSINTLKHSIWGNKEVIFHSRDIRKCEKEFQKLFDLELKKYFYEELNKIMTDSKFTIIASAIDKQALLKNSVMDESVNEVYEIALSFLFDNAITVLEKLDPDATLSFILEMRGKKEDKQLGNYLRRIIDRGTGVVTLDQVRRFKPTFQFVDKKQNINGLQLADLIAYPIARFVIEPKRANPAFDLLEPKIYRTVDGWDGLVIYP